MKKLPWRGGLIAVLVAAVGATAIAWSTPEQRSKQVKVSTPGVTAAPQTIPYIDWDEQAAIEDERAIAAYLAAVHEQNQRDIDAYLDALYQEQLRQQAAQRQAPKPAPTSIERPVVTDGDIWWQLALCECGGNPSCNTGNGFYGTFQFLLSTWRAVGGEGYPHEHSYEEQKLRAQILQQRAGWGQWPACARKLGLL